MSMPLVDLRTKISHQTDAVLEAVHRATGRDKSEIVREVLADWASQKIHEASLLHLTLRREGLRGIDGGMPVSVRESQGSQRHGRPVDPGAATDFGGL